MNKKILLLIIVSAIIAILIFFAAILPNIRNQSDINTPTVQDVKIESIRPGQGDIVAKNGDSLMVNFITTLSNGREVDSSFDRKSLITFKLGAGEVMKGWDIGTLGMKVGEIRRLTIPPNLAYGSEGLESLGIPENATLISTIELISIK